MDNKALIVGSGFLLLWSCLGRTTPIDCNTPVIWQHTMNYKELGGCLIEEQWLTESTPVGTVTAADISLTLPDQDILGFSLAPSPPEPLWAGGIVAPDAVIAAAQSGKKAQRSTQATQSAAGASIGIQPSGIPIPLSVTAIGGGVVAFAVLGRRMRRRFTRRRSTSSTRQPGRRRA